MPVVPKRPLTWNGGAANNAWKTLQKPDGTDYDVFESGAYVDFLKWTDVLRNNVEELRVQINGTDGIKKHLDRVDARESAHHGAQAGQIAELRAVVDSGGPFPG